MAEKGTHRAEGSARAKVQRCAVAGTRLQESEPLGQCQGLCPGMQELQTVGPGLLILALRGGAGGARRPSRGPGRAGADQRAARAPAGFPRPTAGAGVASGSSSGGRLGKAGVSGPSSPQEHQPINLQSPREMLRGFAFCLANYSTSTLFLSWGALAFCRSLIKRKPLSQLPQGWATSENPGGHPPGPGRGVGASSQGLAPTEQVGVICLQMRKPRPPRDLLP